VRWWPRTRAAVRREEAARKALEDSRRQRPEVRRVAQELQKHLQENHFGERMSRAFGGRP
jgi:hypothetical protein